MTTSIYSAVLNHSTTAGFRAWGSGLSSNLTAAGLVKTTDSGQINWTTVNKPTLAMTVAGYEIWKLPDSSIFFKLEYGNHSDATSPLIYVTSGTGSSGAGAITGAISPQTFITMGNPPFSISQLYLTYISVTNNHLTLVLASAGNNAQHPMAIYNCAKTVDSAGAPTTVGYGSFIPYNGGLQSVRISPATAYTRNLNGYGCLPGMPTETLTTNAEYQAYQSFLNLPEVKPYIGMCGICTFEAPKGTIFSYKPVGTVTRSYLSVAANNFAELNTSFSSALLWE
jgi:hypothetical protein